MRLHGVAPSSEFEAQTSLHLPTGAPITSPERRSWWDTRTGPGSDSITGVPVSLPDALGGDAITTSGLIYDADGNHTFLENNRGQKQWKQMQRQLNKALDSIAARSDNPAEALQVEVMAMGESSDADFPAIYADLFRESHL